MVQYKPKEFGLDWPLCPQINIGCPDKANTDFNSRLFSTGIGTVGHAHLFVKGNQFSNHICLRDFRWLYKDILLHEYGHVVAQLPLEDAHGEYYQFVMKSIIKRPDLSGPSFTWENLKTYEPLGEYK